MVFRQYPVFTLVHIRRMQSAMRRRLHQFHQSAEQTFTPALRLELLSAVLLPVYVLAFVCDFEVLAFQSELNTQSVNVTIGLS